MIEKKCKSSLICLQITTLIVVSLHLEYLLTTRLTLNQTSKSNVDNTWNFIILECKNSIVWQIECVRN